MGIRLVINRYHTHYNYFRFSIFSIFNKMVFHHFIVVILLIAHIHERNILILRQLSSCLCLQVSNKNVKYAFDSRQTDMSVWKQSVLSVSREIVCDFMLPPETTILLIPTSGDGRSRARFLLRFYTEVKDALIIR